MHTAAKHRITYTATEVAGHVVGLRPSELIVRAGDHEYAAKRAMSCLVAPCLGDRVLLAVIDDGSAYVLAVLEREGEEPAVLDAGRSTQLRVARGRLDLVAEEGVGLASPGEVSLVSPKLEVRALEGKIGVDRLLAVGTELVAEAVRLRSVAGAVETVADRVTQRVKRVFRFVEELDQLRARRVDYTAKKALHLHGENSLLTAEKLVKMDGENIHMG